MLISPTQSLIDELDHCDTHITPNCLRALYDFVYYPLAPQENSIGIGGFPVVHTVPPPLG